jgi:hypothetical protein
MAMMQQNPFLSDSFKTIWLKHFFSKNSKAKGFNFFKHLEFIKHTNALTYVNVGKTHTKGIGYEIDATYDSGLNKKSFLIYDVPSYFQVDTTALGNKIKLLKSKQYPGLLIETGKYDSLNAYLRDHFSKNSRNKNNKYKRRLEASFNISYKMFFGEISRTEYDFVFSQFKLLLEKRFEDKQVTNNNLDEKEWSFYYDVAYALILEKKASLYVIYDNQKPIGITLSYFSEDTLFDAITVFDIDYFKFHLGSVTIMKLIEWCIAHNIKILDFSKGYFEYKTRWCTLSYDFEYHIYYDCKSLKSKIIANSIKQIYDFKQRLREKNIHERLHKVTYKLRHKAQGKNEKVTYSFKDADLSEIDGDFRTIDFEFLENKTLKLMVFEFLYLYAENCNHIKLLKLNSRDNTYVIEGKQKAILASINFN